MRARPPQAAGWALPRSARRRGLRRGRPRPDRPPPAPPTALAVPWRTSAASWFPTPTGPGRPAALERAAARAPLALGPDRRAAVEPADLVGAGADDAPRRRRPAPSPRAAARAPRTTSAAAAVRGARSWPADGGAAPGTADELTERAAERMRETALAYLDHRGNAVAMARALHLHPQTVRYRVNRLRELLGEQLDDPDARFELEVALRSEAAG